MARSLVARGRSLVALVCLLLAFPLGAVAGQARADAPSVVVEISGLRSDRGEVRGALFGSPRGWPEAGREIATCRGPIEHGEATCELRGVPAGSYAFAFLHDEDGDGELDRDFFGFPQEGYGFSNDAAPGLGPPSFESARFRHDGARTEIHLRTRYGI